MTAHLHDPAPLEHDNGVGAANRRKPVSDDERRSIHHQRRKGLLHEQLGFRVERRGRLVQHQNRRILQQRARDG